MRGAAYLPWELTGAVVGAGLASGREVASFFSRYGPWSWAGILLALGMLAFLSGASLPEAWRGRFPERVWCVMQTLLLVFTGGAMLSGAGEIAALTLPIHAASFLGGGATLAMACFLARRTAAGLATVSRVLLAVLAVLIALGLTQPPMRAVCLRESGPSQALLRGLTYGGFNAALQTPILRQYGELSRRARRRGVIGMCLLVGLLLCLCNAVLLRHPALMGEEMPFVRLAGQYGWAGYVLGAAALWLAILSTLVACIRSLGCGVRPLVWIVLVAMLGFRGAVEAAYPVLGGGCMLMLLLMRLRGASARPSSR